jgi:hypothetical protein
MQQARWARSRTSLCACCKSSAVQLDPYAPTVYLNATKTFRHPKRLLLDFEAVFCSGPLSTSTPGKPGRMLCIFCTIKSDIDTWTYMVRRTATRVSLPKRSICTGCVRSGFRNIQCLLRDSSRIHIRNDVVEGSLDAKTSRSITVKQGSCDTESASQMTIPRRDLFPIMLPTRCAPIVICRAAGTPRMHANAI